MAVALEVLVRAMYFLASCRPGKGRRRNEEAVAGDNACAWRGGTGETPVVLDEKRARGLWARFEGLCWATETVASPSRRL